MDLFESMFTAIEDNVFYDWLDQNGSKLSKVELLRILKEYVYAFESETYDTNDIIDELSNRFLV